MDENINIAIISLGGVALGFMLNEIAGLIKLRRADKRLVKRVLFRLLDIHHFTSPVKIDQISIILHDWIHLKDPNVAKEISTQELQELTQKIIDIFFDTIQHEELTSISKSYEESIVELAEIDPFLAFSLSGRSKIPSSLNRYLESISLQFSHEDMNGNLSSKEILLAIKGFYDQELNDLLEEDIAKVSKQLNILLRFRIKKYLRNKKKNIEPDINKRLDEMFDIILSKVKN